MNDCKFQPLSNYILLEASLKVPKKHGKLWIPETVERPILDSKVVAISLECGDNGNPFVKNVKVGDKVLYDPMVAKGINIWGKDYLLIRESDLYGILDGYDENELEEYEPTEPSNIIRPKFN